MLVSFQSFGSKIVAAEIARDKADAKFRDVIAIAMQGFLDACAVNGITRDEAGTKSIGKEIRESQVFIDAVAQNHIERNTVTNYAQSAMRAYFHNAQWYASAFLAEDKGGLPALPWSKGSKGKTGSKAGGIKTTDDKALLESIRKALEQAVILKRDVVRSILIDAAVELDPEFKV